MNRLKNYHSGCPVYILDLKLSAFFDQSIGDIAVVYDISNNWYTVNIDNLAVLH